MIEKTMREEHDAWLKMCQAIMDKFGLTREQFNSGEYKPIVIAIERWAYYDRKRREALKEYGTKEQQKYVDDFGIFFEGD